MYTATTKNPIILHTVKVIFLYICHIGNVYNTHCKTYFESTQYVNYLKLRFYDKIMFNYSFCLYVSTICCTAFPMTLKYHRFMF